MSDIRFLRCVLLIRIILVENGKLIFSDIQTEMRKRMMPYQDIERFYFEEYTSKLFNKDKKFIRDVWKIDLECDRRTKKYIINEVSESIFQNDFIDSAIVLASLNSDMLLPKYVFTETKKNTGIEYFKQICNAIEKNMVLKISYFNYQTEEENIKYIEPYHLKQKDYKWYVLARDRNDNDADFKSYALERIVKIEELDKFRSKQIDFKSPYEFAIGMFTNEKEEEVVLEFDHRDGNYLKVNPIHHTQEIIGETEESRRFRFYVKPNEDFIMEIMKRTWSLKVIKPEHLKEKFLNYWEDAIKRNKNSPK